MTQIDLFADIGGTNARVVFRIEEAALSRVYLRKSADFDALDALLLDVMAEAGLQPTRAAVAVPGPVLMDTVQLTNLPWHFTCTALGRALGVGEDIAVFNDLEAVAWSLPLLGKTDLDVLRPGRPQPRAPHVVVAPGTGLGVAALVPALLSHWTAVASEGGHALAAAPRKDLEGYDALWTDPPPAWEDLLSGGGLLRIYRAIAQHPQADEPAHVSELARAGDTAARDSVDVFSELLGACAGDMVMIFGAHAGCYIAGGVVPALGASFSPSRFEKGFLAKGAFASYLEPVPVLLIREPYPALRGLVAFIDR